ncbi:MAG: hypothetical protein LJD31_04780 [Wolbachia endosymbiont of Menacanthus eurysternus]|nr:hypothetical protein [Wolbachia endosymbiont of Menacanthus eurysternus]
MEQLEKIVEEISSKPNLSKRNIIDEIKINYRKRIQMHMVSGEKISLI